MEGAATFQVVQLSPAQIATSRADFESLLIDALTNSVSGRARDIPREVASTLELAQRHPAYVFVVAREGSRLLGAVTGCCEPPDGAFINWVAVRPDAQRQGFGNMLLDHFEHVTSVRRLSGMVNLDDPVAVAFWRQRGWARLHPPPRRVVMGRQLGRPSPTTARRHVNVRLKMSQAGRDDATEAIERELNALSEALGVPLTELDPPPGYAHISLAVIDSVFSLRAPYAAARNAVLAYCAATGVSDAPLSHAQSADFAEDTLDDFIALAGERRGQELARALFGGNSQVAPGTSVLKADTCLTAGVALKSCGVVSRSDLTDTDLRDAAKRAWMNVHGLGQQSWSYVTMLSGTDDWKVDTWVVRFVARATGQDIDASSARALLDSALRSLAGRGIEVSKRAADHAVWRYESGRPDGT